MLELAQIGLVILEKKMKLGRVNRLADGLRDDGQQAIDQKISLSSIELKRD